MIIFFCTAVLGGWVYDKGLHLEKSEYNKWSAIVAIPSDEIATFEYKYVADGKYEDGPNRRQFFSPLFSPLFFVVYTADLMCPQWTRV